MTDSVMLCPVLCVLYLQVLCFTVPISSHTSAKNVSPYKVAVACLLPPDTTYMCRVQPVEVLSLWLIWSSETKIKTCPCVITLYLVIGMSCAIPAEGISLSFL